MDDNEWWKDPTVTGKAPLGNVGNSLSEKNGDKKTWWDQGLPPVQDQDEPKPLVFAKGADNPFFNSVSKIVESRLKDLDLDGEAEMLNPAWWEWNKRNQTSGRLREENEPVQTRKLIFQEIASQGKGWKFHLNFDAQDPAKVQTVGNFLTAMEECGAITAFKIGKGGGKESDAPGKEATVYIGHRNKANAMAPIIEEALGGVLDDPEGDALKDDVVFTPLVRGRFEITNLDPEFHQYGAKGHPLLRDDMRGSPQWQRTSMVDEQDSARFKKEATARANSCLKERYGVFYTGSQAAV